MGEHVATGTFEVAMSPQEPSIVGTGQFGIAKKWSGDLVAQGSGLMLSAGDPASGKAGYVALEVVEGTLHGRAGGFAFAQLGLMAGDEPNLRYVVVPGSGSGELTGIGGELALTIEDGVHSYDLAYRLPD